MQIVNMPKIQKTISISDFRGSLASHLAQVKKHPLVISARRGGDSFVVLSADTYNALVEAKQDAADARELARLVQKERGTKRVIWKK